MAKARVNLKGVSRAVDKLTKDLKNLRKKPATQARRTEATALHRKLTAVRTLLTDCPDNMFRMFDITEPTTTAKRARKTTKSTRKGTRKGR